MSFGETVREPLRETAPMPLEIVAETALFELQESVALPPLVIVEGETHISQVGAGLVRLGTSRSLYDPLLSPPSLPPSPQQASAGNASENPPFETVGISTKRLPANARAIAASIENLIVELMINFLLVITGFLRTSRLKKCKSRCLKNSKNLVSGRMSSLILPANRLSAAPHDMRTAAACARLGRDRPSTLARRPEVPGLLASCLRRVAPGDRAAEPGRHHDRLSARDFVHRCLPGRRAYLTDRPLAAPAYAGVGPRAALSTNWPGTCLPQTCGICIVGDEDEYEAVRGRLPDGTPQVDELIRHALLCPSRRCQGDEGQCRRNEKLLHALFSFSGFADLGALDPISSFYQYRYTLYTHMYILSSGTTKPVRF